MHVRLATRYHESSKEPLKLGIGPACYHFIYQGATIQGQKITPPHPAPRVRVDHTLKPEVFRGASLRNRVCVCYGPLEKK